MGNIFEHVNRRTDKPLLKIKMNGIDKCLVSRMMHLKDDQQEYLDEKRVK